MASHLNNIPVIRLSGPESEMVMLRICYSDTDDGQRWSLCGQLAGPWVDELRSCWRHARKVAPRSHALVNLSDVTFIDENGERLLAEMRNAGAEFASAGVETRHLIENLKDKGQRPLRRLLRDLTHPCGELRSTKNKTNGGNSE